LNRKGSKLRGYVDDETEVMPRINEEEKAAPEPTDVGEPEASEVADSEEPPPTVPEPEVTPEPEEPEESEEPQMPPPKRRQAKQKPPVDAPAATRKPRQPVRNTERVEPARPVSYAEALRQFYEATTRIRAEEKRNQYNSFFGI